METQPDVFRPPSPQITSFVIRFVHGEAGEPVLAPQAGQWDKSPGYRGSIRHIQTDQEIAFTRWEEAMAFMRRFVPLEG